MLKIVDNIEGLNFTKFLDFCFQYSSHFSLTQNGYKEYAESQEHADFLKELNPFFVKTITTQHWHCYNVPKGYQIKVYLFRTDLKAKEIILNHFDNLFFREREKNLPGTVKMLPEDICFFTKNKLFIGTVSHEGICNVFPYSEQIYNQVKDIGKWKEDDDMYDEQINIIL